MSFTAHLQSRLIAFNGAFHAYLCAEDKMAALSSKSISKHKIYAGSHLNHIVRQEVNALCKEYDCNKGDTRAVIDNEEAMAVLCKDVGLFDEYDRGSEGADKETDDSKIKSFTSKLNESDLKEYLAKSASQLIDKGLSMAAENIGKSFGLIKGFNYVGKNCVIKPNRVTLYAENSARWDMNEVYWSNREFQQMARNIANDLNVMAKHTGTQSAGIIFHQLGNDLHDLGVYEKLKTGHTIIGQGVNQIKVHKMHVALTISRECFDAMLSFIISNSQDVTLDIKGLSAA
jgi:hypothetical protein